MNQDGSLSGRRGRPAKERLSQADTAFLRGQILETYKTFAAFHQEVFREVNSPKYRQLGYPCPSDVSTVDRAFDDAFSGRRSLPALYWKILGELIGIDQSSLPSRACPNPDAGSASTPGARSSHDADDGPVAVAEVPNNLPRRDQVVVGRDAEIEKVLRVLARSSRAWLVSITGVGGVGKSALALEVAYRCLGQEELPPDLSSEDLVFTAFVWTSAKRTELDGAVVRPRFVVTPNLPSILHEIIRVIAPERTGALPSEEQQRKMAIDLLRKHRTLLIVDNLETVDDEQVLSFLKDIPEPSKVIVTDRRAVHESRSLPLMELSVDDAKHLITEQCESELLRDRVSLSEGQVDELARNTGGIPLAIIWAVGRIAAGGGDPAMVLRRLADVGSSPVLGFLFDESHRSIRERSRRLLGALALPGTPVSGDALGSWLGMGQCDVEDALEELKQFALISECSLVAGDRRSVFALPAFRRHYRLLPLTREYVLKQGVQPDEGLRTRIAAWMLELVAAQGGNADWPDIDTIDRIEQHRDLLAWYIQDAHDRQRHDVVVEMVRKCGYALGIRGYNDLRYRLAKIGVDSARVMGDSREVARVLLTNKAWIEFVWADHVACAATLAEGAEAAKNAEDGMLQAVALRLQAQVAKESGDTTKAEALLADALRRFKGLDDLYQTAITLGTWGSLQRDLGRQEESEASMREALLITAGLPNSEELRSIMCQKLTWLLIRQERLAEAEELNRQAEDLLRHLRRQMGVAYCRRNEALIAEKRSDIAGALTLAREAETLFNLSRAGQEIAEVLRRLEEKAANLDRGAAPKREVGATMTLEAKVSKGSRK